MQPHAGPPYLEMTGPPAVSRMPSPDARSPPQRHQWWHAGAVQKRPTKYYKDVSSSAAAAVVFNCHEGCKRFKEQP